MKKLSILLFGVLLAIGLSRPAAAAEYAIDTDGMHASITFRVSHLGFSWIHGRFDDFEGTFTFDEKNPAATKISVRIDPASINTNHAGRDNHLRSKDFLNVDAYPEARFESTSVTVTGDNSARVRGNLTLHGVTKEIEITAQYVGGGKDPWGGYRQGFTGVARFNPNDFGAGNGWVNEIIMTLDIEGIRK